MKRRTTCRDSRKPGQAHALLLAVVGIQLVHGMAVSGAAAQPASSRLLRSGTAFFVTHAGTMLTSAHVVRGCKMIVVWPRNEASVPASLILVDDRLDVALLSTRRAVTRIAVPASHPLAAGAPVFTIGFGLTVSSPRVPVFTSGEVKGEVDINGRRLLVLRAELHEGNSGGPLIDTSGRLVGMIVGRYADAPESSVAVRLQDLARVPGAMPAPGESPVQPLAGESWRSRLENIAALVQCVDDG
jgi:S1-C subfamily serine protease